jgi:type I restriction enzyme S subunit
MTKQNTIPKGWEETRLAQIVTLSKLQWKPGDKKEKYIGLEHINQEDLSINGFNFSSKLKSNKFYFNKNDILFGKLRPYFRKVWKAKFKGICSTDIWVFRAKTKYSQNFLFYFLANPLFIRKVSGASIGTKMPRADWEFLKGLVYNVPPLPEQKAIAAVLSSLDDKIELLREENKTLESIAQTIFKEWFVKFNFPDEDGKPYKDNGGKTVASELGKIPEGWKVGGLIENNISEFIKPNVDKFIGEKNYVETSNVNLSNFVGKFEKITNKERPSRANMQPVKNSIWFARMAKSKKYLLFLDSDIKNIGQKILSTGFAGIKYTKEYLPFYWSFILSNTFDRLKNQFAEGAVQISINNDNIKKILLVLPPREIAEKFANITMFCFEKVSINNSQIQTLSTLRDTLLPKLMRGEIRVQGFDN